MGVVDTEEGRSERELPLNATVLDAPFFLGAPSLDATFLDLDVLVPVSGCSTHTHAHTHIEKFHPYIDIHAHT